MLVMDECDWWEDMHSWYKELDVVVGMVECDSWKDVYGWYEESAVVVDLFIWNCFSIFLWKVNML